MDDTDSAAIEVASRLVRGKGTGNLLVRCAKSIVFQARRLIWNLAEIEARLIELLSASRPRSGLVRIKWAMPPYRPASRTIFAIAANCMNDVPS
jgi:hypothetical protein